MTRKDIGREVVIVAGTAILSGALFWMAVYLGGPITMFPGAAILFAFIAWSARKMTTLRLVGERVAMACLLAAQASLFTAIILVVLPEFVHGIV